MDHQEPIAIVNRDHGSITILGTAHISHVSADKVKELIEGGNFDAVAIELCPQRHHALINPDALARMDLFKVIREGKAALVAASLALSAFQQRIADQMNIKPGAEMRVAIEAAAAKHLPVLLIDRDIGTTLKRVYRNVPFWRRMHLFSGLLASIISRQSVTEREIEQLKRGDILSSTFAQFEREQQFIYEPLVAERDRYMAAKIESELIQTPYKNVLAIVGAGHLHGIEKTLNVGIEQPEETISALERIPEPSIWIKALPWLFVAAMVAGMFWGFNRDSALGWSLLSDFVLISGGLAALGSLIALAHPVTIIATFIAAPITILNPFIGIGMVSAPVEIWMRKPKVADFNSLRTDATSLKGWIRNRVTRTLLVFVMSSIGASIGAFAAGYHIVDKLAK